MSTELCFFKIQWDLLGKHISAGVPATFEPEGGLPAIKSMLLRAQGGSRDASDVRRWCVEHLYGSLRRIEDLEAGGTMGSEGEALTHALPEHIQKLPLADRIKCVQSALAPKSVSGVADEAFKGHVYASLPQAIRDLPPVEQINQIQKFFADEPIKQSLKTLNDAEAFRSLKARLIESKQFTQAQMDNETLDVLFSRALRDTSVHDAETKILAEETTKLKRISESRLTLYNDAMDVISSAMVLLKDYTGTLPTRVKAALRDAQKAKVAPKEAPVVPSAPDEEESKEDHALQEVANSKEIERLRGEVYLGNQEIKRMLGTIADLNMDLSHAKSTYKIYYTGWKRAEKAAEHISPEGLTRLAAALVKACDQKQPVQMNTETTGIGTEKDILDAVEELLGLQAPAPAQEAPTPVPAQDTPALNPTLKTTLSVGEHQIRLTDFWGDGESLPRSMCFASDHCAERLYGLRVYPMVATYIREDLIPSQTPSEEKASEKAPESIAHKMVGLLSKELEHAESNVDGLPIRMILANNDGQTSTVDFSDIRVIKGTQACQGIVFKPGKSILDPAAPAVDTNSLVLVAAWNGQAPADWDPTQPSHVSVNGLGK